MEENNKYVIALANLHNFCMDENDTVQPEYQLDELGSIPLETIGNESQPIGRLPKKF